MVGWCGIYSRGCSRIRGNWSQDENVQLRGRSLWWLRPVKSRDARIAFGGEGLEDTRDPPGTFQGLSLPIYRRRTSQGRKGKISRRVLVKRECSRYGHWVGIYPLKIYIRQISCLPFLSPEDTTTTAKSRNFSSFPFSSFFVWKFVTRSIKISRRKKRNE